MLLVAVEELLAQGFQFRAVQRQAEGRGNHRARAAGDHVAHLLLVHRRQAVGGTHGLGDGDEVRRRVEQGAIHVEQYRFEPHALHASRWVWTM